MDVLRRQGVWELAGDGVGLGDLLRFQPTPVQHIVEIHVAAEVQLVGSIEADSPVVEQAGQHPMHDGGPDLALDVVADQRELSFAEAAGPVVRRGDEDRDAVHQGATGFEDLLDVPLGGHLRAHRQVIDDDVSLGFLQDPDDVVGRPVGFLDHLRQVGSQSIVGHPPVDGDSQVGDLGEPESVVRMSMDCLAQIQPDLALDHVEGCAELDVADVVAAQIDVHQAGDLVTGFGVAVIGDSLDQRRGAIAHTDDGHPNLLLAWHADLLVRPTHRAAVALRKVLAIPRGKGLC